MKTHIRGLVWLAVLASTLAVAGPTLAETTRHVIIIGVDGMSRNGVVTADTPVMHDMMNKGSSSLHARGVLPTTSSANWASVLNGAGPEQHGVTTNDWQVGDFNFPTSVTGSGNFFPSLFQIVTDQHPEWEVGSIYQWGGFGNLYDHRFVDYDVNTKDEDDTARVAADYIRSKRPQLLFVHLDHVDHAGHADGHGTAKYYDAVAKADRLIGVIRQATVEAGIADDTVIIVTSDHGGVGKGHGGETLAELEIPWIAYGPAIHAGRKLDQPINTFDTPATVAKLLNVKIPYAWLGRPVSLALKGEPAPEQMYRTSNFYASPLVEPVNEGNAPAGGLFINKPAVMSIRNPNPVGEVRYTLDNSAPTATSTLYTKPVNITQSTIVRATLFVDGKPASVPTTAYFRLINDKPATQKGVAYRVYGLSEGTARLPDFSQMTPITDGHSYEFSIDGLALPQTANVAVVFEGYLDIETAGSHTFILASDDGSKLYIDDKTVVDNDGDHGVISAGDAIELTPGKHKIRVEWFNGGGGAWLGAYYQGPNLPRQFIDANRLTPMK